MITIEETRQFPLSEVLGRSPVGDTPATLETVGSFIRWSEQVFTVRVNAQVVAVWGVIRPSLLSGEGYLWLIPTAVEDKHKFMLVRHSQRAMEWLLKRYTRLIGHCLVDDLQARRWLSLLGAKFDFPENGTVPFRIERR